MALYVKNNLEIEKLLIWNTELPLEHKTRQSPPFWLMGLQWCLQFTYFSPNFNSYHMITLHQVVGGQVTPFDPTERQKRMQKEKNFSVKTFLMNPMTHGSDEMGVRYKKHEYRSMWIWFGGGNKDDIFKMLPCLYDRCEVKVVCKFYDNSQATFGLQISADADAQKLPNQTGFIDNSIQVPQNVQSLSNDFSHLLEKEILTDVKLECGDQTFQAHKSVLAARSKVFYAMFHSKMTESTTSAVKISDIDAQVLKLLLRFIYSGKIDYLTEDNSVDLYEAADKYDVISLRQTCAYWITKNLTLKNCVKYLKMADSHSDSDLKDSVASFIVNNLILLKSEEWLALSKKSPVLAVEVFQAYVASTVQ